MSEVTLVHNVIMPDGKFVPRGTVIDRDELPPHLRKPKYIEEGAVHINKVMPVDMIEVGDELDVHGEGEQHVMKELTLDELQPKVKPKKLVRKK
jgi:hypothetical protein